MTNTTPPLLHKECHKCKHSNIFFKETVMQNMGLFDFKCEHCNTILTFEDKELEDPNDTGGVDPWGEKAL